MNGICSLINKCLSQLLSRTNYTNFDSYSQQCKEQVFHIRVILAPIYHSKANFNKASLLYNYCQRFVVYHSIPQDFCQTTLWSNQLVTYEPQLLNYKIQLIYIRNCLSLNIRTSMCCLLKDII